jgi:hypothetical protein
VLRFPARTQSPETLCVIVAKKRRIHIYFKKMKNNLTLLIFLFLFKTSFSQTTKNFNGVYKNGKASYQYYEGKQNEIIMNGKFYFTRNNTITESGKFKDNLKNGKWDYVYKEHKKQVKISGFYKNDLKNGLWKFNLADENSEKKYLLNFKNDTLIGKINIDGLTGEFDSYGKYINNWTVEYDGFLYNASFKDNILIKLSRIKTDERNLVGLYNPEISKIDFLNLNDERNNIVRQKYDLEGSVRTIVDDFQISKVYGVPDYDENLQEKLFYNFFDDIESKIEESAFLALGWSFLKEFRLINNPEFLYTEFKQNETTKISEVEDRTFIDVDIFSYNVPLDEEPYFINGNNKFVKYIIENYSNFENVSGKAFIKFNIDKEGKLTILTIKTTGNVSENELRKVVDKSPKWKPGKKDGKTVAVTFSIPITISKN